MHGLLHNLINILIAWSIISQHIFSSLFDLKTTPFEQVAYLVKGGEPVHVGRIDVGASPYQSVDLVSVGGGASGQEHAPVGELDPARLVLRLARLQESVGLQVS